MRRKYDLRNKRNFIIIISISIVIISIFSFFVYKFIKIGKIEYTVISGSVVMDANNDSLVLSSDAKLKMKWSQNYYLLYQDKEKLLDKHVIVYNEKVNALYLYGLFYEVKSKEEIIKTQEETIIESLVEPRFYKLEDRKYLIVAGNIMSSDNVLETSNYLLVELDKQGNAKLTNNTVNMKTISKTTLVTTSFEFDIANEILMYGEEKIDLKKIIGTTNEYKEAPIPDKKEEEDDTSNQENNNNNNNNNNLLPPVANTNVGTVITPETNGEVVNNAEDDTKPVEEKKKSTITSVLNVNPSYTSIAVDYVVYDPYSNYNNIYVEVRAKDGSLVSKINLPKNGNNLIIDNLNYNSEYSLLFKYDYLDESGVEQVSTFYTATNIKTNSPNYVIELNKVSSINATLSYKIILDNKALTELIDGSDDISFNVTLNVGDNTLNDTLTKSITTGKIPKYVGGIFNLPTLTSGQIVTIQLKSVTMKGQTINYDNVYYKYINS